MSPGDAKNTKNCAIFALGGRRLAERRLTTGMNLPFELFVAVRYLLARRKQAFISVISFISALGVVVGVVALIVALALMTGLQLELRDRILGSTAHVYVWKQGGIEDYAAEARALGRLPHVLGAAPAIQGMGLVSGGGASAAINVKGIDPQLEASVTDVERSMRRGSLDALGRRGREFPGILIGVDLAKKLNVDVGDTVRLMTLHATPSPLGALFRPRTLEVVGVFSFGLYEFDSSYGFVALDVASRLFDTGIELIELRVDDIYRAREIAAEVERTLGPAYMTQDWSDLNQSLFSALWLEKMAISITIGLIVMVAALNIVASLVLLVMEKHRDIAILKTMGASHRSIMTVFMLQGLIIGIVGTAIGAASGYTLVQILDRYQLVRLPMDVYQVSHVPFRLQTPDFLLVLASAILICFVATIYPSRQAARLDPAEALRYG